jgi:hypothetical protein
LLCQDTPCGCDRQTFDVRSPKVQSNGAGHVYIYARV